MNFNLIKNANVKVTPVTTYVGNKRVQSCDVLINDEIAHRFPSTSRVTKHLDIMTPDELGARLSGGMYFVINDQLIDFRDGNYNGFVHNDHTIKMFMEVLGAQPYGDMPLARQRRHDGDEDSAHSKLVLRKVWNKTEISVPGYQNGGNFNSELSFTWNPFVKTVNSAFDLVRLVCTNGMIGLTSFLNTKVPLFNRWDEHLDIAARQIQNKVNDTVVERVQRMRLERASLSDCLLVASHAFSRMTSNPNGFPLQLKQRERLERLFNIANPRTHLDNVYRSEVYEDKVLSAQLPGHLTNLDIFNIATEIRTHSNDTARKR